MRFIKRFIERIRFIISSKRAELDINGTAAGWVLNKTAEVIVGGTTYIVNSFFKKETQNTVVDKVRRLIERDADNLPEK